MKPEIENLKVWMSGRSTTGYQRALAMRELEQLLTYVSKLYQLRQPPVSESVCSCDKPEFVKDTFIGIIFCNKCAKDKEQTDY